MRNITLVILLGFIGVACDQIYDAQKNSEQNSAFMEDEYNRLTLDTAYVNEMYEAYQERSGNDEMMLTLTQNEYGDTKGYELTDTTFDVNVFAGPEELELVQAQTEMHYQKQGKPIPVARAVKRLVGKHRLLPVDLHFINQQGRIVVGDTLYHITPNRIRAEKVENPYADEDVGIKYCPGDPIPLSIGTQDCHDDGGGGGGAPPPDDDDDLLTNSQKDWFPQRDFGIQFEDANGHPYEIRAESHRDIYRNRIGVRRAKSATRFDARSITDPSDDWMSVTDRENINPGKFSHLEPETEARLKTEFRRWFNCDVRERSDSGEWNAEVVRTRCGDGALTWHTAIIEQGPDQVVFYDDFELY